MKFFVEVVTRMIEVMVLYFLLWIIIIFFLPIGK